MRRTGALALALALAAMTAFYFRPAAPGPEAPDGRTATVEAPARAVPTDEEPPAEPATPPPAAGKAEDAPPDPERDPPHNTESAPLPAPLRFLLVTQNADGSWGDADADFESARYTRRSATALSLLAFLEYGLTHLTKETLIVEGSVKCSGVAVKSGIKWMQENPGGEVFDMAITSLAWGRAYSMTGSKILRVFADRSYARLWELQDEDGSWGGESRTSTWAAAALLAAEEGRIEVPDSARSRAAAWFSRSFEAHPSPQDAAGWALLAAADDETGRARAVEALRDWSPAPFRPDADFQFHGSLAVQRLDRRTGPLGTSWRQRVLESLRDSTDFDFLRSRNGSGTASVVRVALAQMALAECWFPTQYWNEEDKR